MSKQTITLTLPKLYPKQYEAIYSQARYSLIEASTKSGKTHGCIAWAIDQVSSLKNGQESWWIAPVSYQSDVAFNRTTRYLPPEIYDANKTKSSITLLSGAVLRFKSGDKPDNLYGEDVYSAVIDEASRMREESWFAIRSTITKTKGRVRIIGNVKGRKNWFYRMCRKAQAGEPDYDYHKITAWDAVEAGVLEKAEIESAMRDLPEAVFRELYLAEPSDDGGNPFGANWIEECLMQSLTRNDPVVWGWDLAKHQDYTVGIGLDSTGRMCRFERFQKPWRETKRIIIQLTGSTPALIDSTGVGDPILEDVQAECQQAEGYLFNSKSKQILMEGLANAIQSEEIAFTEQVKTELDIFEYEYSRNGVKYSAPAGFNDDMVCALALANYHYRTHGNRPQNDVGFY